MVDPPFLLTTIPISCIQSSQGDQLLMLRTYSGSELEDEPKFVEGSSEPAEKARSDGIL